jgi:hypothetical protein
VAAGRMPAARRMSLTWIPHSSGILYVLYAAVAIYSIWKHTTQNHDSLGHLSFLSEMKLGFKVRCPRIQEKINKILFLLTYPSKLNSCSRI